MAEESKSIESLCARRKVDLPYDCQIKRQTRDGDHRPVVNSTCPNCGWVFPFARAEISGARPISGKRLDLA